MNGLQVVAAIAGTALIGVGGAMALTNPGQENYEEYAVEQLTTYLKEEVCTQNIPNTFENFLQRQCVSLVDTGRPQIRQIISETTQRQNYLLFSVYQTDLNVGPFLPAYQFESVGAFQQFYTYQAEKL
ncbi:MAG: DUF4359 domain-containing protein [Kastovskya adunca ATA6-11-RM4]|jgi:hypothetical protein|nr:DUF4359 domain-containing protein [Kastovskya adunca ATA6-11-RM4]